MFYLYDVGVFLNKLPAINLSTLISFSLYNIDYCTGLGAVQGYPIRGACLEDQKGTYDDIYSFGPNKNER